MPRGKSVALKGRLVSPTMGKLGMFACLLYLYCVLYSVSQIFALCAVGNSNVSKIITYSVKMDMQAGSRARAGKEGHCTEHRGHHEHGRQGHQGTVHCKKG
jgi:hypothetical protein